MSESKTYDGTPQSAAEIINWANAGLAPEANVIATPFYRDTIQIRSGSCYVYAKAGDRVVRNDSGKFLVCPSPSTPPEPSVTGG